VDRDESQQSAYDRSAMVQAVRHLLLTSLAVTRALVALALLAMRSRAQLAAENLFLRKQLALYQERKVKPRRADNATRLVLATLSRLLAWRQLLVIVKPETLIRWHRKGFRLFWRWKSRAPGRPAISVEVQRLIATMASANRTWGEERIANELLLKLGTESRRGRCGGTCRRDRVVRTRGRKPGARSCETMPERSWRVISSSS
jgi:putative transposase